MTVTAAGAGGRISVDVRTQIHSVKRGGPASTPASSGAGVTAPSTSAAPGAGVTAPSSWPDPLWQQDCWDTQLRRGESYGEKWEYVRRNPVRAGLCALHEEWMFQGEISVLTWHD
jgi:hypothetical protein